MAPESAIASSVPRVMLIELVLEAQGAVLVDVLDWVVEMVLASEGCCGHVEQLLVMTVMSSSSGNGWLCVLGGVGAGV